MPTIGPMELIVVLIIGLVFLGPKRLPDAGRALGEGIRGFKSTISGADRDDAVHEVEAATSSPTATPVRSETRPAA